LTAPVAQTRKQVRRSQHLEAQSRNAAARAAAIRAARRKKVGTKVAIGAGVVAVAAAVAIPLATHTSASNLPHPQPAARAVPPPWPAPVHPLANAKNAGLRVNSAETLAEHFHAHLDILVGGKPVTVPADIGIDTTQGQLAELHTHDTTGVIHIEAPDKKHRFVLGQVFAEWDVRLDATHLGGLTAGNGTSLRAYVDGKLAKGNPAGIELKPHEEIALVYGPSNAKVKVPSSYQFQPGE
jgi:hypothetical protein